MRDLNEVELPVASLVVADLHLELEDRASWAPFVQWLEGIAGVPRLVVLGDLFEFWLGSAQAGTDGGRAVLAALREAVAAGTEVDLVPGNRDFLLDRSFERATDARVHHGGFVGRTPAGTRVLFLHGDELSTLDTSYQRLRRVLRTSTVRWLAAHLPAGVSRTVARRLRRASRRAVADKPEARMAQQPDACRDLAREHGADVVVCGHAHRFRDEDLAGARWLVLDAFGGERDTLEVGPDAGLLIRTSGALAPR